MSSKYKKENSNYRKELVELFSKYNFNDSSKNSDEYHKRIGEIYYNKAPKSLFRYRPCNENSIDTLSNDTIWFSLTETLNDPFDCLINVDKDLILNNFYKDFELQNGYHLSFKDKLSLKPELNTYINDFIEEIEGVRGNISITCFSETNRSILMWAHYASGHQGVCIEYSTLEIFESLDLVPVPVNYTDNIASISRINLDETDDYSEISGIFVKSLMTKSPDWKYEKEWRIILDKDAFSKEIDWSNKGALKPMIIPKAIYIGAKAPDSFKSSIINLAKTKGISCYQMEMDPRYYKVAPSKITL